ncbi:hypothetical protein OG555_02845 [Kribbella sp. NBC_01484]|uniref:hypothetical protein n=1 Tax=Kribbella sp. NBC_01484 TaxID=2903579 RepID=UPI002E3528BC|nr:hypothetical protein [Kribbella sp. NBC_01484]
MLSAGHPGHHNRGARRPARGGAPARTVCDGPAVRPQRLLPFSPTTPSTHPHAIDINRNGGNTYTSPEAFAHYHAQDGDEILIRPDGYLG